ncbi:MAG TPA: FtsQ-type POTRA domain-containing protein [Verrucomicrobiae bacterium]|jgi:cell division septal protein FtsQ
MFLKRKKKNRRFERKHILDVKLRSTERRKLRFRRAAVTLSATFVAIIGVFVVWRGGEWLLSRFLYENPSFALHQIDAQTDGAIAPAQLRRWAGVKYDDNLLALDLGRVKRDLEMIPAIQTAFVERVLPHTLRIRVTEREPVAQFAMGPKLGAASNAVFFVDTEGSVMWPLESQQRAVPGQTNDRLPVLLGLSPAEVRIGRKLESAQVRAALELLEAFDRSSMASFLDLKEINLSSPNILQATTSQGSEVVFGFSDMDRQMRRWRAIYDYGQKNGKAVSWVDLSVANNVPARWLEASLAPMQVPKTLKPNRTRKKNV